MCLVYVALVVRSRGLGPRFVFHYPARPEFDVVEKNIRYGTELDPTTDADDDADTDGSDLEDGGFELHREFEEIDFVPEFERQRKKPRHTNPWDGEHHYDENGIQVVPWEHVDNFDTRDLESILTPSRAFHKKRFVLSLDPLTFVTYPIHCYEDGHWKKKKKGKKGKEVSYAASIDTPTGPHASATGSTSASKNENEESTTSEEDHGGMTMFNLVFVLNPERNVGDQKASEIYDNVAKDFNKALQRAQSQANYVWTQSDLIISMKEKAREDRRSMRSLWSKILQESSLGRAMRDVFEAISKNKIANIHLDTKSSIDFSVQIPVPHSSRTLPTMSEPSKPGLWITTASSLEIDEDGLPHQSISKHFALLLLDDADKIISDIQAEAAELAGPLIQFVKISNPTLSFDQVAKTNSIDLNDIRTLAQHLIYWRRAIPIPPLHPRDAYILSPNADHHKLPTASIAWKKAFPLAPCLPSFLATLSTSPRPYKSYPPSRNHRPTYMDMLGWLLRGGWVTQLRTFAYILVWPEVIYEVQHALDKAAIDKEKSKLDIESITRSTLTSKSTSTPLSSELARSSAKEPPDTARKAEDARLQRLHQKFLKDAAAFEKQPLPTRTAHPDQNTAAHLAHLSPHIILDPHRAEDIETLFIAAIAKRFREQSSVLNPGEKGDAKADAKLSKHWLEFVKYFDGKEALEMIAAKEGLKRKETGGLLLGMQQFLLVVRHW